MAKLLARMKDERGSALVVVFMTIVALLLLGAGVMALSVGAAKQSVAVDEYEKLYYPAEGSTQQGIEYVRREALNAYNAIQADLWENVKSSNNAAFFFDRIGSSLAAFAPSDPDQSAGSAVNTLNAGITASGTGNTRTYTITSTAAGDSSQRQVLGTVTVEFKELEQKFATFGDKALVVGRELDLSGVKPGSQLVTDGNVEATGVKYDTGVYPPGESSYPNIDSGTQVVAPPPDRNLNWVLTFGSFGAFIDGFTSDPLIVPQNEGSGANVYFGFKEKTFPTMNFKGAPATTYQLHDVNVPGGGKLVSYADLWIVKDNSPSTLNNMTIITAGDLYVDGVTINHSTIFCGGTLYMRAGNGKVTQISDSITYANRVDIGAQGNGKSEITTGLLYSYTTINIDGNKVTSDVFSYTGQVISRLDTILTREIPNKNALFDYDQAILLALPQMLKDMGASAFIQTLKDMNDGTLYTVKLWPNSDIFKGTTIGEN